MTLRELIAAHPDRFYPQTWYRDEAFLDTAVDARPTLMTLSGLGSVPSSSDGLPFAAQIVAQMLAQSEKPLWRWYLWCADTDAAGQRVYVGQNGKGIEIHRHLHVTARFAIAA